MKIGIYGSSFNPITFGHLWTANTVAKRTGLDKVILLPSSQKRVDKEIVTRDCHRIEMLKLAAEGNPLFEIDDFEMKAPAGKHYTLFTMNHYREKFPEAELFFMMGADLLPGLPKWSYGEELIKTTKFIVIERNGILMHEIIARNKLLRKYEQNFTLLYKGLVNEISSAYIREEFQMGGDPRYLLPDNVYHYIIENKVYMEVE